MQQFVLTCSSTADLPLQYVRARNISFLCYRFEMNGEDHLDDLGQSLPMDAFYRAIDAGAMPTTSQVNNATYYKFFEPMLAAGQAVLHLELSSGISGSYDSACVAQRELAVAYPDSRLVILDSLGASSGFGLLVDAVADLRDAGASLEEAVAFVSENRLRVHHWFFSTDLTHFRRGGRISAASATLGTMLNICPVMHVNPEGKLVQRVKVRGKKGAIREMLKRMRLYAEGGDAYSGKCFLSHAARAQDARQLADEIEAAFPGLDGRVMINDIGAVIGAHTGPGTVALFFFGRPRRADD